MNANESAQDKRVVSPSEKQRETVIADVMARVSLSRLRDVPITTRQRAGAFMLAALRKNDRICAITLARSGNITGEKQMDFGPKWDASALSEELIAFAGSQRSELLVIGVSTRIRWQEIAPFDLAYRTLKERGVSLVDLIEVNEHAFRSIFKQITPGKSDVYTEFAAK